MYAPSALTPDAVEVLALQPWLFGGFTAQRARECLAGQTVLSLGDSTFGEIAVEIGWLLSGTPVVQNPQSV